MWQAEKKRYLSLVSTLVENAKVWWKEITHSTMPITS